MQKLLVVAIPTSFIENTADTNNTFRIYRSNYGRPPAGLKEANFTILGSLDLNTTEAPYELEISGSGQEANGSVIYDDDCWILEINDHKTRKRLCSGTEHSGSR